MMADRVFRLCILFTTLLFIPFVESTAQDKGKIKTIKSATFKKKLDKNKNIQLIDVRTPEEFNINHLTGAINYNIADSTLYNQVNHLDKNKPVYVYCRSGARSLKAADFLKEQGFKVFNLKGGIIDWQAKDLPLSTSSK